MPTKKGHLSGRGAYVGQKTYTHVIDEDPHLSPDQMLEMRICARSYGACLSFTQDEATGKSILVFQRQNSAGPRHIIEIGREVVTCFHDVLYPAFAFHPSLATATA